MELSLEDISALTTAPLAMDEPEKSTMTKTLASKAADSSKIHALLAAMIAHPQHLPLHHSELTRHRQTSGRLKLSGLEFLLRGEGFPHIRDAICCRLIRSDITNLLLRLWKGYKCDHTRNTIILRSGGVVEFNKYDCELGPAQDIVVGPCETHGRWATEPMMLCQNHVVSDAWKARKMKSLAKANSPIAWACEACSDYLRAPGDKGAKICSCKGKWKELAKKWICRGCVEKLEDEELVEAGKRWRSAVFAPRPVTVEKRGWHDTVRT